jgi:hypothetical protein
MSDRRPPAARPGRDGRLAVVGDAVNLIDLVRLMADLLLFLALAIALWGLLDSYLPEDWRRNHGR